MSMRRNDLLPLYCTPGKWDHSLTGLTGWERKQKRIERQRELSRMGAERRARKRAKKLAEYRARKRAQRLAQDRCRQQNGKQSTNANQVIKLPARRKEYLLTSLPQECQRSAIRISKELGESDSRAVFKIAEIVDAFSQEKIDALVEKALAVHRAGGEWTCDRSRMRTLGGVFFRLAKDEFGAG